MRLNFLWLRAVYSREYHGPQAILVGAFLVMQMAGLPRIVAYQTRDVMELHDDMSAGNGM